MKQSGIVSEKPSIVWANNVLLDEDRLDGKFYDVKFVDKQTKLLKSDIPKVKLKDIITNMNAPIGWQGIPSSAYRKRGNGIPLIRIQNIKENQVNLESVIDVDPQIYNEQPAIQAEKNDIIITRVGTIGRLCKVPSNVSRVAMGQNLTRISFNTDNVDVDFILAYMNTDYCLNQMIRFAYGGVQPSLTNKNIKDLLIIFPELEIQHYIGNKFRKAEQLRENAKKLENEARALIVKYLKIDELKDKINSPDVKQKWNLISPDKLADRLDSEYYKKKYSILNDHLTLLRKLNIKVLSLKEIIKNGSYGILPRSSDYGKGELTFIRSTDLKGYMINFDSCEKVPMEYNLEKARVSSGEILLEIKGAISGGAIVIDNITEAIVNGSIYKFSVKEEFNNFYVLAILQSLIGDLQKEKYGANSVISYLSLDVIQNLRIPVLDQ
ncbi:restriction endonuclease subunit S, partial [Metabacillus fastidiosus]|uniref:restriction endonuclease subunit S n=1 Tax=Metabacillus fastidiosus TaxID=1458 RepID=UPI002DB85305